ncbi:MAG TPA: proton-conducting transporter membrane subunit [Oculatellaceae cyanobacterium]
MTELVLIAFVPTVMLYFSLACTNTRLCQLVSAGSTWVQLAVVTYLLFPLLSGADTHLVFAHGLGLDRIGACFVVLTTFIMACCVTHADYFFVCEKKDSSASGTWPIRMFYACIHLFLLAMTFVFMCDNLGYLWIGVETTTLSSAPLVYFERSRNALEASWKYLIICSVGIAFALLGTVFIFAASQHGMVERGTLAISDLIANAHKLNFPLLRLGFIFCLLGYGTKAGVFPLHSWLPDAYSEAPAPASAMLSAALCNCALFAIWRIVQITQATNTHAPSFELVAALGAVTVVAAGILLIRQHSFKRMWAYSSIENVGIMLVAIGLGSGGLFLLQAINHSLGKAAVFLLSGNIIQSAGSKKLDEIRGVLKSNPLLGVLLGMAALAVTGSPPFGTFVSEIGILVASADSSHWILATFLTIGIAVSFIAVLVHVSGILFGAPPKSYVAAKSMRASVVPALLLGGTLILGAVVHIDFFTRLQ